MTDEPTPWEEINPPVTVSARQQGQLSPYSARLTPASSEEFRNELTACLALVAPVGMTEEAKRDWLAVAWGTLKDLPPDILSTACRKARETCDHPSKIVPTIRAEAADWMRIRRESAAWERPMPSEEPEYCSPAEAAKILAEFGLKPSPGSKPNGRDPAEGLDAQHESRNSAK